MPGHYWQEEAGLGDLLVCWVASFLEYVVMEIISTWLMPNHNVTMWSGQGNRFPLTMDSVGIYSTPVLT